MKKPTVLLHALCLWVEKIMDHSKKTQESTGFWFVLFRPHRWKWPKTLISWWRTNKGFFNPMRWTFWRSTSKKNTPSQPPATPPAPSQDFFNTPPSAAAPAASGPGPVQTKEEDHSAPLMPWSSISSDLTPEEQLNQALKEKLSFSENLENYMGCLQQISSKEEIEYGKQNANPQDKIFCKGISDLLDLVREKNTNQEKNPFDLENKFDAFKWIFVSIFTQRRNRRNTDIKNESKLSFIGPNENQFLFSYVFNEIKKYKHFQNFFIKESYCGKIDGNGYPDLEKIIPCIQVCKAYKLSFPVNAKTKAKYFYPRKLWQVILSPQSNETSSLTTLLDLIKLQDFGTEKLESPYQVPYIKKTVIEVIGSYFYDYMLYNIEKKRNNKEEEALLPIAILEELKKRQPELIGQADGSFFGKLFTLPFEKITRIVEWFFDQDQFDENYSKISEPPYLNISFWDSFFSSCSESILKIEKNEGSPWVSEFQKIAQLSNKHYQRTKSPEQGNSGDHRYVKLKKRLFNRENPVLMYLVESLENQTSKNNFFLDRTKKPYEILNVLNCIFETIITTDEQLDLFMNIEPEKPSTKSIIKKFTGKTMLSRILISSFEHNLPEVFQVMENVVSLKNDAFSVADNEGNNGLHLFAINFSSTRSSSGTLKILKDFIKYFGLFSIDAWSSKNNEGNTPLHLFAKNLTDESDNIVFLNYFFDLFIKDPSKASTLMNTQNIKGETPFMLWMSLCGTDDFLKSLSRFSCKDFVDQSNQTALHYFTLNYPLLFKNRYDVTEDIPIPRINFFTKIFNLMPKNYLEHFDDKKQTPLISALRFGNTQLALFLFSKQENKVVLNKNNSEIIKHMHHTLSSESHIKYWIHIKRMIIDISKDTDLERPTSDLLEKNLDPKNKACIWQAMCEIYIHKGEIFDPFVTKINEARENIDQPELYMEAAYGLIKSTTDPSISFIEETLSKIESPDFQNLFLIVRELRSFGFFSFSNQNKDLLSLLVKEKKEPKIQDSCKKFIKKILPSILDNLDPAIDTNKESTMKLIFPDISPEKIKQLQRYVSEVVDSREKQEGPHQKNLSTVILEQVVFAISLEDSLPHFEVKDGFFVWKRNENEEINISLLLQEANLGQIELKQNFISDSSASLTEKLFSLCTEKKERISHFTKVTDPVLRDLPLELKSIIYSYTTSTGCKWINEFLRGNTELFIKEKSDDPKWIAKSFVESILLHVAVRRIPDIFFERQTTIANEIIMLYIKLLEENHLFDRLENFPEPLIIPPIQSMEKFISTLSSIKLLELESTEHYDQIFLEELNKISEFIKKTYEIPSCTRRNCEAKLLELRETTEPSHQELQQIYDLEKSMDRISYFEDLLKKIDVRREQINVLKIMIATCERRHPSLEHSIQEAIPHRIIHIYNDLAATNHWFQNLPSFPSNLIFPFIDDSIEFMEKIQAIKYLQPNFNKEDTQHALTEIKKIIEDSDEKTRRIAYLEKGLKHIDEYFRKVQELKSMIILGETSINKHKDESSSLNNSLSKFFSFDIKRRESLFTLPKEEVARRSQSTIRTPVHLDSFLSFSKGENSFGASLIDPFLIESKSLPGYHNLAPLSQHPEENEVIIPLGMNLIFSPDLNNPSKFHLTYGAQPLETTSSYLTQNAVHHAWANHLSKPYRDCSDAVTIAQQTVERPNHGLPHTWRKTNIFPVWVDALRKYGTEEIKNFCDSMGEDQMNMLQMALAFSVTGRESECSFQNNPKQYQKYKQASAQNFTAYIEQMCSTLDNLLEASQEQLNPNNPLRRMLNTMKQHKETYALLVLNMGNPEFAKQPSNDQITRPSEFNSTDYNQFLKHSVSLLNLAHDADLLRCYHAKAYETTMETHRTALFDQDHLGTKGGYVDVIRRIQVIIEQQGDQLLCQMNEEGHIIDASLNAYREPFSQAASTVSQAKHHAGKP